MEFPCAGVTAEGEPCHSVFLVFRGRHGTYYCRHHAPEDAVRINHDSDEENFSFEEESESSSSENSEEESLNSEESYSSENGESDESDDDSDDSDDESEDVFPRQKPTMKRLRHSDEIEDGNHHPAKRRRIIIDLTED